MLKNERQDKILELLMKEKYLTVDRLVSELHYSPSTIRRDLIVLDGLGLIRKNYGGVSLNTVSRPPIIREHDNIGTKIRICKAASRLIKNGDTVFIDGTTTTFFISEFIDKCNNITVVTNNLKLALILAEKHIPCYVTGGLVYDTTMLGGTFAADLIEKMQFDIAFFSIGSINNDGYYSISEFFREMTRAIIPRSSKNVLLYDDSKTKIVGKRNFKDISCMDAVISNAQFPKSWKSKFEKTEFINV